MSHREDPAFFQSAKPYFSSVRLYKIDVAAIRQQLLNAPLEGQKTLSPVPLEVPMPDGSSDVFNMVESPLLSPALAEQFPAIKTYSGYGLKNKRAVISISLTSNGLSAIILNTDKGPVYIEKTQTDTQTDRYRSYYSQDARSPQSNQGKMVRPQCGAVGVMGLTPLLNGKARVAANIGIGNNTVGTQFRTFRLAVAVTGEFTRKHDGQAKAYNDIVAYVNRVKAVYKNELCVTFQLVSGPEIVYTDPATDPYTGNSTDKMIEENQPVLDDKINDDKYDLGMVVSATFPSSGNTSSGGGIARLESLGKTGDKAKNAMEEGDWEAGGTSFSQLYTDQVFSHEIGHQFGMLHTFNSNLGTCKDNGTLAGTVEPGAGTTIMSYGYTCSNEKASQGPVGDDNYGAEGLPNGPFLNFHAGSFALATQYMATIPSVGSTVATTNTPPVVSVPATTYTIPKSTPFSLTGSATDADNDALTYSWEGIDIGTTTTPDPTVFADPTKPPFFRSYAPSATGNLRSYPLLSAILDGTNATKGEKLPAVTFSTTHRLTVRDNSAKGGGVVSTDVTVNVDGNTGPFLVSNDWQGTYGGNTSQTITWSVNGTNTATPNVKISLSTDGGQTFPTVLVASTANTGSATVIVPNVTTSTGRLKIEAVGNIFFDLSNKDFSINPTTASPPVLSGLSNATTCSGVASVSQSFSVTDSEPASVSLVATSSNTSLVPVENIVLSGTGTNRSVIITPVSGQSGTVVVSVTATNSAKLTGSASFTLTVNSTPAISNGPISVTITSGQSTRFSVSATGDNLVYQWQLDGGNGFTNVMADGTYSGVSSAILSVASATTALNGYQYRVLVGSGSCSSISTNAALRVNPGQPDLTAILYARPSTLYNTTSVAVVVDVEEVLGFPTSGPVVVRLTKDAKMPLSFSSTASSVNGRSVQNSVWTMDDSNADYYILSTSQVVAGGDKLSVGLTGVMTPGATSGSLTVSAVITGGSGGEIRLNNNTDADKIDYFQQ